MPSPKGLYSVVSSIFKNFYIRRNPVQNSFILQPVSEEFVYKELSSLNVSKSTGLDDLPARFIRDGASVLTSPITFIINQSILTETVPSTMKQARVKPLFKKNSPLDVGNYRPVSILSIVSKVLERSVYNQLYGFLQTNGLLYELQSGFRSKYSTDSCLIHLLDFIRGNNDKGLYTGMIMLDLQKAFDTVDHTILCDKLEGIGVLSVNWFKSYLSDRIQYVSLKGQVSDPCNVSCGVPQGSILGPLLFLLYVNDMSTSIDEDCKLLLYADDSAILFVHKDVDFISVKLGKVLEKCSDWLIDNRLSLHLGKTECMLFGPPRKLATVTDFHIRCYDTVIKSTEVVKYLGVQIDRYLKFDYVVNSIVNKVNARLKFMYRNAKCLDFQSRLTICTALIQCHFDYASSAWFSSIGKTQIKRLQVAQNKMIRFILDLGPRVTISEEYLEKVKMLRIADRVTQLRLNHVFNIVNGSAPSYLTQNFVFNEGRTRGANSRNFVIPGHNQCSKNSFTYCAIKDWNKLPTNIKSCNIKATFKPLVKNFLKGEARTSAEQVYLYY